MPKSRTARKLDELQISKARLALESGCALTAVAARFGATTKCLSHYGLHVPHVKPARERRGKLHWKRWSVNCARGFND
jgi:hypothetical protein